MWCPAPAITMYFPLNQEFINRMLVIYITDSLLALKDINLQWQKTYSYNFRASIMWRSKMKQEMQYKGRILQKQHEFTVMYLLDMQVSDPPREDTHPQLVSNRLSPTWSEAMPKSAIRMLFFSSRSRFSGFRSLWLHKRKKGVALGLCISILIWCSFICGGEKCFLRTENFDPF